MNWNILKRTSQGDWSPDSPPTFTGTLDEVNKYVADRNEAAKKQGGAPVEYKSEQA